MLAQPTHLPVLGYSGGADVKTVSALLHATLLPASGQACVGHTAATTRAAAAPLTSSSAPRPPQKTLKPEDKAGSRSGCSTSTCLTFYRQHRLQLPAAHEGGNVAVQ